MTSESTSRFSGERQSSWAVERHLFGETDCDSPRDSLEKQQKHSKRSMNRGVILKNHPKQCMCCILFQGNHFKMTSSSSFWSLQYATVTITSDETYHFTTWMPYPDAALQVVPLKREKWDQNHWFFEFHVSEKQLGYFPLLVWQRSL